MVNLLVYMLRELKLRKQVGVYRDAWTGKMRYRWPDGLRERWIHGDTLNVGVQDGNKESIEVRRRIEYPFVPPPTADSAIQETTSAGDVSQEDISKAQPQGLQEGSLVIPEIYAPEVLELLQDPESFYRLESNQDLEHHPAQNHTSNLFISMPGQYQFPNTAQGMHPSWNGIAHFQSTTHANTAISPLLVPYVIPRPIEMLRSPWDDASAGATRTRDDTFVDQYLEVEMLRGYNGLQMDCNRLVADSMVNQGLERLQLE